MHIGAYIRLMRLDKPIGIYLLLWPTLWALWLASNGIPQLKILIIFILGVVLMRSAGCVINDIIDRNLDKFIRRTKNRPISSGEITVRSALMLFFALLLLAFFLLLMTNLLTLTLASIAMILTGIYPFMKRYTHLPQLILGMAFAMSAPMSFAAITNYIDYRAWLVFITSIVWTMIYDSIYAIVDREDDIKIGIKSSAILFGRFDTIIIAILQIVLLLLFIAIGFLFELSGVYYGFLFIAAALMMYYQYLIKDRNKVRCFQAFLRSHYLGALIFTAIFING